MSACTTSVRLKALSPAEVGEMATKKKVAVSSFRHDSVGLSGKIEAKISNYKLDNKKYFKVLSRKDINKVISEQKLQSSALMDETSSVRIGKLIGAQAIVSGEIASAHAESTSYLEDREKCLKYVKKEGCVKYRYYKVRCFMTKAQVSANINIVDVQDGSIIYGDAINKNYNSNSCRNSRNVLSKSQAKNYLTSLIADEFVHKLTPHYVYFSVELLESLDIDLNDKQELMFKRSIEYIKVGRMDRADKLLLRLMDEVNGSSYVIAYNYGVLKEARAELNEAKKLYSLADEISTEPIKEIIQALVRIDESLYKTNEAKRQINAN